MTPRRRKAVVVINVEQEDGKLTNDVTRLRGLISPWRRSSRLPPTRGWPSGMT